MVTPLYLNLTAQFSLVSNYSFKPSFLISMSFKYPTHQPPICPSSTSSTIHFPCCPLSCSGGLQVNESWSVKTSWDSTRTKCCFQMWVQTSGCSLEMSYCREAWVEQIEGRRGGKREQRGTGGSALERWGKYKWSQIRKSKKKENGT